MHWQYKSADGFGKWLKEDLPLTDIDAQLSIGLLANFKFDEYHNLTTPNEVPDGYQGRANVKIISELIEPEMIKGREGRAMKFDGKNYLSLGDVGDFEECDRFSIGGWVKPMKYPEKMTGLFVRRNGEQRRGGYELVMGTNGSLSGSLVHNHSAERMDVKTKKTLASEPVVPCLHDL